LFKLSNQGWKILIKRFTVCMVLFFIPFAQLYSALVALPLFLMPEINTNSAYMGYTFGYFYPKRIVTVIGFAVYYFVLFYGVSMLREKAKRT